LENIYTYQEYEDVSVSDDTRVSQSATDENAVHLYKKQNSNNTDQIDILWEGQTDIAPSLSAVYLQIYNRTLTEWETIDSDNISNADTDFELTGSITASLSDYYDESNWVAVRVYQEGA